MSLRQAGDVLVGPSSVGVRVVVVCSYVSHQRCAALGWDLPPTKTVPPFTHIFSPTFNIAP
eukprot:scaffold7955_cov93-Cylindrotheca_fusiformis.AAC.5